MTTTENNITHKLDKEVASIIKRYRIEQNSKASKDEFTFLDFFRDRMLIIRVIREGVPYSFFDLIRRYAPFSENDWANFLDISTKSLQRYKQTSKQFKPIQSEKIIEMAEVTSVGLDVFGTPVKFKLWLDTPNFALGSLKPIELLKDSYGKEMVIGELARVNHGILA